MNIKTANRLAEMRKKMGYSQEELASKLGISRQSVSKWERSEASPDTDNLIALSKIYGVTLDDLVNVDKDIDETVANATGTKSDTVNKEKEEEVNKEENKEEKNPSKVHINFGKGFSLHVKDGKDEVHIGSDGVHIVSEDGDNVDINGQGIHIDSNEKESVKAEVVEDGDRVVIKTKKSRWHKILAIFSSCGFFLATVAYLLMGFLWKSNNGDAVGWKAGWIVFLLVPFIMSVMECIIKKNIAKLNITFLVISVYCGLGLIGSSYGVQLWHPWWIIFFIIPIFYSVIGVIKKSKEEW